MEKCEENGESVGYEGHDQRYRHTMTNADFAVRAFPGGTCILEEGDRKELTSDIFQ